VFTIFRVALWSAFTADAEAAQDNEDMLGMFVDQISCKWRQCGSVTNVTPVSNDKVSIFQCECVNMSYSGDDAYQTTEETFDIVLHRLIVNYL
jgi:hypothetical protein